MLEYVFMFICYGAGTAMGLWFAKDRLKNSIEVTIDNLIAQGFIQTETKPDGEVSNPSALFPKVPALVYERVPSGFKI